MMGDGPIRRNVRDHVAVPLLNREWMQRLITDKASQLQISYRRGPLGDHRRLPTSGPRAGDRIADRLLTTVDGQQIRLFEVLGPGWALIGDPGLGAVARDRLGDLVADFRGDGHDTLLVRPDAHLGWRGRDPQSLRRWLDDQLGCRAGLLVR